MSVLIIKQWWGVGVFFVCLVVFVLVFVSFMAVLLSMGDPSSSTRH